MELYARPLLLRNESYFMHRRSDYGSQYETYPFLSTQMLQWGLGRLESFKRHLDDSYEDVQKEEIGEKEIKQHLREEWGQFYATPALLVNQETLKPKEAAPETDTQKFNTKHEHDPQKDVSSGVFPKYGRMNFIRPENHFFTVVASQKRSVLEQLETGTTFLMGKKRPMFKIAQTTPVQSLEQRNGPADTNIFLQVATGSGLLTEFETYSVYDLSQRYQILRGTFNNSVQHLEFKLNGENHEANIPTALFDQK
jgi:hypothetical protein